MPMDKQIVISNSMFRLDLSLIFPHHLKLATNAVYTNMRRQC